MDLNAFDVLRRVLADLLVLLGVARGLTRLPIGIGALVEAFRLAEQFHWQVVVSMVRVGDMSEPGCEDGA